MHPRDHAVSRADKPAVIIAETGDALTYGELEAEANRVAHLLRSAGCGQGNVVAFVLENSLDVFRFVWGAQRAGLIYVAISNRLKAAEIEYIVRDSGAKLLLASDVLSDETLSMLGQRLPDLALFAVGEGRQGWRNWQAELARQPATPIPDESRGIDMLYSSGTTGQPKGVVPKFPADDPIDAPEALVSLAQNLFGATSDTVYLSPAPLYHAAPLRWCMAIMRLGGTVVIMQKFHAESLLCYIEAYKVSIAQFVPTHFVRLLQLAPELRTGHDLSSLKTAVHAAAPCPPDVKQKMIDWWGPILMEYYGGSEGNGITMITSSEWLQRPGSVGKAILGTPHVCDEEGNPLPQGSTGLIYFEGGPDFRYHNDPEKTQGAYNALGWSTLGDIGRIDEDGYVFLTDRKSFMIITGGVNVYPQEIENHIQSHPDVLDVAVVGGPDPDMGEKVIAFIQLVPGAEKQPHDVRAADMDAFCRASLSAIKIPREYHFVEALERTETGKLMKRKLRDQLWQDEKS